MTLFEIALQRLQHMEGCCLAPQYFTKAHIAYDGTLAEIKRLNVHSYLHSYNYIRTHVNL